MPGNSCGAHVTRIFPITTYSRIHSLERRGIAPLIRRAFKGEVLDLPAILYDPGETIPGLEGDPDAKRWVSAIIYPLRSEDGSVQEVALIHQDITDRRRAEDALQAARDELEVRVEITHAGAGRDKFTSCTRDGRAGTCRGRTAAVDKAAFHYTRG